MGADTNNEAAELIVETARITHEVNRAYCAAIGDDSQKPWEHADAHQRESAVAGVCALADIPGLTPEMLHENWMAEKRKAGWKYGLIKDASLKIHPCMKPYADLPAEQRIKDHLFRAVVLAILQPSKAPTIGPAAANEATVQ